VITAHHFLLESKLARLIDPGGQTQTSRIAGLARQLLGCHVPLCGGLSGVRVTGALPLFPTPVGLALSPSGIGVKNGGKG
jgi:hypothetical protein